MALHKYFIKTHWLVKKFFSSYVWSMPATEKALYFTFDDGPHPQVTPFVLDELKKYNAAATFFCVGENVEMHPEVFQQILYEGHAVGNHTYHHLNGWQTSVEQYLNDVAEAANFIQTPLFRPPYGRIKKAQAKGVAAAMNHKDARIIMWDVLSADFDTGFSKEQCLQNVLKNATNGSIIVFHDSEKAYPNLKYALPIALEKFAEQGYVFKKL